MRRRAWYWPAGLIALLAVSAAANIAFMLVATGDPSFAVERDYYRKAILWDQTMAQAERNGALRWSVAPRLEPMPGSPRLMTLWARVRDASGADLGDAMVRVEAFHGARAGQVVEGTLRAGEAGYVATLPMARPGLWELRFRVERAGAVFTQVLTHEVPAAP